METKELTIKNDPRKYAIYSRKSKFTGKGESIENQIELCKQFLNSKFEGVSEDELLVFEDEGYSGKNTNRPEFQKMLKAIRNNEVKIVACYKMDRISRNLSDFVEMYDEFSDYNVEFVSKNDNFDTSTSMGRAMLQITMVFAQLERETIAERIRDNMIELAKSGRWLGGTTPTGYKSTQVTGSITFDGKERKAYKLDIVPEEAKTIKLIYSKFLETKSLTQVETYLLQNRIKTKFNKNYTRFSVKSILHNPVYVTADQTMLEYCNDKGIAVYADESKFNGKYGIMAYNKTAQTAGKANKIKDFSEWVVAVGKHKPLISSDDWIMVQRLLAQNTSKSYRKPKSNVALLSGLLHCSKCGGFMRPKLTQRRNANGELIYDYLCETKEKSKGVICDCKRVQGNILDKAICDKVKELTFDKSEFNTQLKSMERKLNDSVTQYKNNISNLEKTINKNNKDIERLIESITSSDNSPADNLIKEKINRLSEENKTIEKQIDKNRLAIESQNLSDLNLEILKTTLDSFSTTFEDMTVEQKRVALRTFIKRIDFDGENVEVYMNTDDEFDISSKKVFENSKEPQGVDSERNTDAFSQHKEKCLGCLSWGFA